MRPHAIAPMSGRVWLNVSIASLKPWPGGASTCAAGTWTPSSMTCAVSLARCPSLSSCLPTREALGVAMDDERADALVPELGVLGREDDVEAREVRVRDPRLRAGEHVAAVRLLHRARLQAGDVAAGARLGRRVAHLDRLAREPAEVLLLLLLGAGELDRREAERVRRHARLDAAAAVGELLGDRAPSRDRRGRSRRTRRGASG